MTDTTGAATETTGAAGSAATGDSATGGDGAATGATATVRVTLPAHLRTIAHVEHEVHLDVAGPVTQRSVLDELEAAYPNLRGTIRDQSTFKRRAFVRFFACEEDLSHEDPDALLPPEVVSGKEPYMVIGAMAGG